MSTSRVLAFLLGLTALLPACGQEQRESLPAADAGRDHLVDEAPVRRSSGLPVLTTHAYVCDGPYVVAHLEADGSLFLFLPEETLRLQPQESASGVRHGNGRVTFWSKGEEALLDRGRGNESCLEDRRASLVEDAKLRGVDFRATGNEPPWILEIGPEEIVVYTGYESTPQAFPAVQPTTDPEAKRSEWATEDASGRILHVVVWIPADGSPCFDSMSDDRFESTVEVTLDDHTLFGCGRALH